jgi:ribose 5-phosphate isomerase B
MKIAFGCDHAGWYLKQPVMEFLKARKIEFFDVGTNSPESVDYPDFAARVALLVVRQEVEFGILICGTGLGMAMTANKFPGIRAITVSEGFSAQMARAHNNANVLTMGSRVVGAGLAVHIIDLFLSTPFEGGRHEKRLNKLAELEKSIRTSGEDI